MKKSLNFILVLFAINIFAQEGNKTVSKFRLNILSPGISYENTITDKSTLNFDANLSIGYIKNNQTNNIITSTYFRGQYRYYYNILKRENTNKNISNNSSNFIALNSSYYFKSLNDKNAISIYDGLTLGGVWGIQRSYKSGLNINFITGLGYNFTTEKKQQMVPIINFTIGWILFDK